MVHVIFDLDGTLIDSKQEIIETYREVFAQHPPKSNVNFDAVSFTETLDANLKFIYKEDIQTIAEAKKTFANVYDKSSFENTLLYNGVFEVLQQLNESKYMLHVATNKRLVPTLRILELKKLLPIFKSVKASNQVAGTIISKEDMVREICNEFNIVDGFMVGDGRGDIEAGQACNLTTVAVTYGYEDKSLLIKKNPTFIIDTITDLLNITKLKRA